MMIEEKLYTQPNTSTVQNNRVSNLPKQLSVYIYPEVKTEEISKVPEKSEHQNTNHPGRQDAQISQILHRSTNLNQANGCTIHNDQHPQKILSSASGLFKDYQEAVARTVPVEAQLSFPPGASTFNPNLFGKGRMVVSSADDQAYKRASALELIAFQSQMVLESGLMSIAERESWLEAIRQRHFFNSIIELQERQEREAKRRSGIEAPSLEIMKH